MRSYNLMARMSMLVALGTPSVFASVYECKFTRIVDETLKSPREEKLIKTVAVTPTPFEAIEDIELGLVDGIKMRANLHGDAKELIATLYGLAEATDKLVVSATATLPIEGGFLMIDTEQGKVTLALGCAVKK